MSLFERLKNKRYALQEQETIKDPWFDDNPDLENKNNTKNNTKNKGRSANTGGSGPDYSSTSSKTGNMKGKKTYKKPITKPVTKPVTYPSNKIYVPSPSELQKLTSKGFKKTTTGAFTKVGKKSFRQLLVKGLSKMGTKGKIAAGLLALGTTTYGIKKLGDVNKTKNQNTMVPPIGFNQTPPKPMKFGISLGPGQQQK